MPLTLFFLPPFFLAKMHSFSKFPLTSDKSYHVDSCGFIYVKGHATPPTLWIRCHMHRMNAPGPRPRANSPPGASGLRTDMVAESDTPNIRVPAFEDLSAHAQLKPGPSARLSCMRIISTTHNYHLQAHVTCTLPVCQMTRGWRWLRIF